MADQDRAQPDIPLNGQGVLVFDPLSLRIEAELASSSFGVPPFLEGEISDCLVPLFDVTRNESGTVIKVNATLAGWQTHNEPEETSIEDYALGRTQCVFLRDEKVVFADSGAVSRFPVQVSFDNTVYLWVAEVPEGLQPNGLGLVTAVRELMEMWQEGKKKKRFVSLPMQDFQHSQELHGLPVSITQEFNVRIDSYGGLSFVGRNDDPGLLPPLSPDNHIEFGANGPLLMWFSSRDINSLPACIFLTGHDAWWDEGEYPDDF